MDILDDMWVNYQQNFFLKWTTPLSLCIFLVKVVKLLSNFSCSFFSVVFYIMITRYSMHFLLGFPVKTCCCWKWSKRFCWFAVSLPLLWNESFVFIKINSWKSHDFTLLLGVRFSLCLDGATGINSMQDSKRILCPACLTTGWMTSKWNRPQVFCTSPLTCSSSHMYSTSPSNACTSTQFCIFVRLITERVCVCVLWTPLHLHTFSIRHSLRLTMYV